MHVISPGALRAFWRRHRDAEGALKQWLSDARAARWASLEDVRRAYPHADAVKVTSGATVTVFNIKGNAYRLIVALHYNRQKAFIRDFLTHAEYSKNAWKHRH
jgi:mRNA interferase HigB